ncbi:hypothetical protein AHF37_00964 [Paragonimus kellicotti]|nr:hypothetical protein AHF37_00964 [Paragonimus kellicotti]
MTLRCDVDYYGDRCHLYCDPKAQTYTCTPEGRRICRAEYRGPLCDIRDWCLLKPCAANATCVLKLDGEGRRCICNGRDSIQLTIILFRRREGILDKSTTPVHFYESTILQNDSVNVDQRLNCSTSSTVSEHNGLEDATQENLTTAQNGSTHSEADVNGTADEQHSEPKCTTRTLPETPIPIDPSILKNPAKTINTVKYRSQYNPPCEPKPRVFRRVHYNEPLTECKQYFV